MPLFFTVFIASILVFFVPGSAHAYVGPGLGLGAIGAFIGIIFAVILALVGLFWYPLKRMFKKGDTTAGDATVAQNEQKETEQPNDTNTPNKSEKNDQP